MVSGFEYLEQDYKIHFHQGPHQPRGCLQRAECNLGLHECNYSSTRGKELYIWPLEGNHEADVAPGENEFFTYDLE